MLKTLYVWMAAYNCSRILGCGFATLPVKYLGLPLGASYKSTHIWDGVVEKIEHRLASWKMLYLSKGGRVTPIKSTLANVPTYFLSLFHLPRSVAARIEKLQRDFLWGGLGEESKVHLVKWSKVCSPFSIGGLGIRNFLLFNQALLGKWLWRYGIEREAWWRVAVDAKFGSLWGGWCSRELVGAHGVGLWKNIRKWWGSFSGLSRLEVRDGARTKFWHDLWCRDRVLKESFPVLFSIARMKDASIADNMEVLGGSIQWNVSFVREAHDWEVSVFASFFHVLHLATVSRDLADRLRWVPSKKGVFKVKSYFSSLVGCEGSHFPWKSVWRTQAPSRAAFFAWSAALGKILTADNLKKRKIIIVDRCYLSKRDGEIVDRCHQMPPSIS
jgi:hypothetical protein